MKSKLIYCLSVLFLTASICGAPMYPKLSLVLAFMYGLGQASLIVILCYPMFRIWLKLKHRTRASNQQHKHKGNEEPA